MPFVYLPESKRFVNLATIAYTAQTDKYLTVYFSAGNGNGPLYQAFCGADADVLRKCLKLEADDWSIENYPGELEVSF